MDYAQGAITTLHDLTDPTPDAPVSDSAVVVPIAGDQTGAVTPAHVFETLASLGPAEVIVPLRSPRPVAQAFQEWVSEFDLDVTMLWCNADSVERRLADAGLDGAHGKGRDVWLGLGVATSRARYVAVHDADATTYDASHLPRLLAPLGMDYEFVKGYYARVEDDRLYGRLTRLFVAPLLAALAECHDDPLVEYLGAFRYPLAGEMAVTAETARRLRAQRTWGLEIGVLGEAYTVAGPERTAQVDLGVHRHDHRPVDGDEGLSNMAEPVGDALFRVLADNGLDVDYEGLRPAFRTHAERLCDQYEADARFNGLAYDRAREREQYHTYEDGITPPDPDTRLPAWNDVPFTPADLFSHVADDAVPTGDALTD